MRTRIAIVVAVLAASTGCGACFGRGTPTPAPEAETVAEKPPAHGNELEVAEDMLRDLRLTTAEVQAARSAESFATIQGELRANEDAYAEVGAPLSGRVTRLLAGTR